MTFEMLAKMVADDFRETMNDEGFDSFEQMCKCYAWEWADVKDEVDAIITEIARREHLELWMSDDQTFIQLGLDDISWRDFKRMMLAELK